MTRGNSNLGNMGSRFGGVKPANYQQTNFLEGFNVDAKRVVDLDQAQATLASQQPVVVPVTLTVEEARIEEEVILELEEPSTIDLILDVVEPTATPTPEPTLTPTATPTPQPTQVPKVPTPKPTTPVNRSFVSKLATPVDTPTLKDEQSI